MQIPTCAELTSWRALIVTCQFFREGGKAQYWKSMLGLFIVVYLSTSNMHLQMHITILLILYSPWRSHFIVVSFQSKHHRDDVNLLRFKACRSSSAPSFTQKSALAQMMLCANAERLRAKRFCLFKYRCLKCNFCKRIMWTPCKMHCSDSFDLPN
jgi:hypothetical protein